MALTVNKINRSKRKLDTKDELKDKKKCSQCPVDNNKSVQPSALRKLTFTFFDIDCVQLARQLLGQHLVRDFEGHRLVGKIVETEAYLGLQDKAAHSYNGKRTDRNEAMFMTPGTAYVYNIYGMYCCLNISSQGEGCAVLIRALEPLEGLDQMKYHRTKHSSNPARAPLKDKDLANGPSKLCQALVISKNQFNKVDLNSSGGLWLEQGENITKEKIVCCSRINIGYAEDWQDKPLRFYILGNLCVSKRDKLAEKHIS